MFSAIKKAFGKEEEVGYAGESGKKPESPRSNAIGNGSPGIHQMDASLQRRFARGIQYNMKIIIRGDRNTGKSSLFQRLKGQNFCEEYTPTEEIQVGSINWSYKTTDDIVKVEVWDVVDRGKRKKKSTSLKIANAPSLPQDVEEAVLDAQWVDVYKGTHGVVMTTDVTKTWTLDYVKRELPKVPPKIPVLVLANFRDMGSSRAIPKADFQCVIEEANSVRGPNAGEVRFAESSMKTAFGLKYLHKFFNIPFLLLQRESLERQMETNSREMTITRRELDALVDSEEQNYDVYCQNTLKRSSDTERSPSKKPGTPTRGGFPADGVLNETLPPPALVSSAATNICPSTPSTPSTLLKTSVVPPTAPAPSLLNHGGKIGATSGNGLVTSSATPSLSSSRESTPPPPSPPSPLPSADLLKDVSQAASPSSCVTVSQDSASLNDATSSALTDLTDLTRSTQIFRISGDDDESESSSIQAIPASYALVTRLDHTEGPSAEILSKPDGAHVPSDCMGGGIAVRGGILSLDDFVADDGIETSFLDDVGAASATFGDQGGAAFNDTESESDDDPNPMVAADQEDLNPEDLSLTLPQFRSKIELSRGPGKHVDSTPDQASVKNDDVDDTRRPSTPEVDSLTIAESPSRGDSWTPTTVKQEEDRGSSPSSPDITDDAPKEVASGDLVRDESSPKVLRFDELEDWLGEEEQSIAEAPNPLGNEDPPNDVSPLAMTSMPPGDEVRQPSLATPTATPSPIDPLQSFVAPLTVDDFNFLETQSGVSSADGESDKKRDKDALILTPSSSVCDISESSERSAESKKKSKKKKKESEEEAPDFQNGHKKKKKHREKEDEECGGKKRGKASKKTSKKTVKEEKTAVDLLGATTESPVGGDYEII